jgi:hypothetical protein
LRLDTGNRSSIGLLGGSLVGLWLACGAGVCVLLSLLAYRVADDGLGILTSGDRDLRPALVFLALVGAGAVLGIVSLWRQTASSSRLARRVRELGLPPPPALAEAAARAGLARRLALVDSEEPFSFAYGVLTPRVVISGRMRCRVLTASRSRQPTRPKGSPPPPDGIGPAAAPPPRPSPSISISGRPAAAPRRTSYS